jgi:hypothetical protein
MRSGDSLAAKPPVRLTQARMGGGLGGGIAPAEDKKAGLIVQAGFSTIN